MYSNTIKCDCGSPVDLDQTDWCDACDKSIFAEPENKIMTPKEKAEELVDKYYSIVWHNGKKVCSMSKQAAKQCALIAVNEMIAFAKHAFSYINIELATPSIVYLEEVKQEIEKL
jgi:exosome complex RNA-binding protein Rrp42 (RNase PH superfamily)